MYSTPLVHSFIQIVKLPVLFLSDSLAGSGSTVFFAIVICLVSRGCVLSSERTSAEIGFIIRKVGTLALMWRLGYSVRSFRISSQLCFVHQQISKVHNVVRCGVTYLRSVIIAPSCYKEVKLFFYVFASVLLFFFKT